jgi:hypothetical protein
MRLSWNKLLGLFVVLLGNVSISVIFFLLLVRFMFSHQLKWSVIRHETDLISYVFVVNTFCHEECHLGYLSSVPWDSISTP